MCNNYSENIGLKKDTSYHSYTNLGLKLSIETLMLSISANGVFQIGQKW